MTQTQPRTNIKAFITLRPIQVVVYDKEWEPIFHMNSLMLLPGGVELHYIGEDGGYLFFQIMDAYFPRLKCKVDRGLENVLTEVKPFTGRTSGVKVRRCSHKEMNKDCRTCWSRWWRERAKQENIKTIPVVEIQ